MQMDARVNWKFSGTNWRPSEVSMETTVLVTQNFPFYCSLLAPSRMGFFYLAIRLQVFRPLGKRLSFWHGKFPEFLNRKCRLTWKHPKLTLHRERTIHKHLRVFFSWIECRFSFGILAWLAILQIRPSCLWLKKKKTFYRLLPILIVQVKAARV